MPKIAAETVAEHAARQERKVFEAAVRLFLERGYEEITFSDIAEEVGLARNSLYRYYPSKGAILVRWIDAELTTSVARAEAILNGDGGALDLIMAWIEDQVRYARRPEHALLISFASARSGLDESSLRRLGEVHDRLSEPLVATLRDAGAAERADLIVDLVFGLVNQASKWPAERDAQLRPLLRAAVEALLSADR